MRLTLIFHLRSGLMPRAVTRGSLYTVVTRSSLMGFHKRIYQGAEDPLCTKTTLLTFVNEQDANEMVRVMEACQGKIPRFQRDIEFQKSGVAMIDNAPEETAGAGGVVHGDSIKPLYVENIPYNHMERLCLINYFDMLIVYDKNIEQLAENWYEISLDCYEYTTQGNPNRDIQEKIFRDMLYHYPEEDYD